MLHTGETLSLWSVRAPRKHRTQSVAFQNYSRQCLRSHARCSDVEIYLRKLLVAAQRNPTKSTKVSEPRIRAHTDMKRSARHQNSINSVTRLRTSKNHRPQHPPYAPSSGTPIRSCNPVSWIQFNTLQFTATHLMQRSSPEGSLVHAPDYTH